ncbi:MAG: cobalamin-dependent protein [Desulfobacterales bacterium]|nr:cobalamin-dependent protein [Desulfobacterales bacterium]
MKTLLLNLPKNIDNCFDYDQVAQPIGLAMISAAMKHEFLDVVLFDAHAYHLKRKEILHLIRNEQADIIGFSVMSYQYPQVISLVKDIKRIFPKIIVVLGGPHIGADYSAVMRKNPEIDIAVRGEGEYIMPQIVKSLSEGYSLKGVKGIAFKKDSEIIITEQPEYIFDLDALPYPDWESLPVKRYWDVFTTRKNYARILGTRGCPYQCSFCGAHIIMGKKYRKRSPMHVIGELKMLYDYYHVREILFNDSTFNIDNEWVSEICEGIIKMGHPIIWRCNVRADRLDKEILKLMKRSGCVKVVMGVESGDENVLKLMNKGENLEQIYKGMEMLKELKMPSDHGFILGMPGETINSLKNTINLACSVKSGIVTFSLATPFPGTQLYAYAQKEEGFSVEDWSKFDFFGAPYITKSLSKEQLLFYYRQALKKIYLRPMYLIRRLLEIKSFINLKIHLWYTFRIIKRRFSLAYFKK